MGVKLGSGVSFYYSGGDLYYKRSVWVYLLWLASFLLRAYLEVDSVCSYTFISIILSSIMIKCRDLALNHPLVVGGSWDSFDPNGTGVTSPALFLPPFANTNPWGIAPIGLINNLCPSLCLSSLFTRLVDNK